MEYFYLKVLQNTPALLRLLHFSLHLTATTTTDEDFVQVGISNQSHPIP
jgi:hypothetical protein